jgi:hypothetical protein
MLRLRLRSVVPLRLVVPLGLMVRQCLSLLAFPMGVQCPMLLPLQE